MSIFCRIFGHKVITDDVGGAIFEVCERCNWVGRKLYDEFQDVFTEIIDEMEKE